MKEARMRIVIAALMIAASSSLALAQSLTATTGNAEPQIKRPAVNDKFPNGQPKAKIPRAARSGERGLRVGEGALDSGTVEIKRLK
jgi:hypothetical protein